MDIGKASNFERYLYNLSGNNAAQTAARWKTLAADGAIDLQPLMDAIRASGFTAGRSDHAARLATIRETYQLYNRLIDPHTADGVYVAKHWRAENKSERPLICLETALPAKFETTVREATGLRAPRPAQFEEIEEAPRRVTVMANDVSALKDYITAALA